MIYFEWAPAKDASNLRKHGVKFEVATQVFEDPFALSEMDRIIDGQRRWKTTGLAGNVVLVVVSLIAIVEEDEYIRIISARGAERKELGHYEKQRQH